MKETMSRAEAHRILEKHVTTPHIILHSRETEVIMRRVAKLLGEDEDMWGNTGLLHDLDMDLIDGDFAEHGYKTVEVLKEEGYDIPVMFEAILSHREALDDAREKRTTRLDYVLSAAEQLTGIISAYVKMRPEKTIVGAKVSSVVKKMKDKSFAANVNRSFINDVDVRCGIERSVFIQCAIDALTDIREEIGM